ncbi:MAG: MgtC/SapB family protein [Scytonematopsis contorta HA4267-MV1]|jgi:putative Mg2+ transporter-C (MgtC) family protein|nr:MgtC/SapB family protein [Scytonematopsis contorta HA4267-MV1]
MSAIFLNSNDWLHILLRLALALLMGFTIGFNRKRNGRQADIKTFMLVGMGSALFVMIPLLAGGGNLSATTNALSRTIQGVTSGVGFIGAGLILQECPKESSVPKVSGLATAASVWIVAALGAAIGCGLWHLGVLGTLFTLATLIGIKRNRSIDSRG